MNNVSSLLRTLQVAIGGLHLWCPRVYDRDCRFGGANGLLAA